MSWISGPCEDNDPPATFLLFDGAEIDALWWPLTKAATDPAATNSLLRELAEESDGTLREIEPGVWYQTKLD